MLIYALNGLGRSQLALQNLDLAARNLEEALELSSRVKDRGIALVVLAGVAELLDCLEKPQEAIELGSLVESNFAGWRETRNHALTMLEALKKSTTAAIYRRARERGRALDLWATVDRMSGGLHQITNKARQTPRRRGPR
jgi:hypothetical protein